MVRSEPGARLPKRGETSVSKLSGELLVAALIAFGILFLSLTLFTAHKLWDKILTLSKFKRMDLEFAGAGSRDGVLYWRRNKVKISLYLALEAFYVAIGATATVLVGLGLMQVFGMLR
ncbi:MAG TPA: hypothetical protein VN715_03675 [Roseiarcus sp.]|nr:hypothetical protein [Roseiarcus sp.]